MNKQFIEFSSGCVISLDDIEDFPDYCETLNKVLTSIEKNKIDYSSLNTILVADIQDIQHIPQFQQVIKSITSNYNQIFTEDKLKHKQNFLILMLKISKSYFTSYNLEQEQVLPILQILSKELSNYIQYFCDFWLSISKFAPYVEKHEELAKLFIAVINQSEILKSEQLSRKYIKSVDKILRFRAFREVFSKYEKEIEKKGVCFFSYKLSLYSRSEKLIQQKRKELTAFISNIKSPSTFILQYIQTTTKN